MATPEKPAARAISPLFFVLALLTFFLPFAGVSCNADTAKSLYASVAQGFGGTGGGSPGAPSTDQANACFDSLKNYNLFTYSGVNLLAGTKPSVADKAPSGCDSLNSSTGGSTSPTSTDADKLKVSPQPLLIASVVLILIGVVVGLLAIPYRAFITAGAALAALVMLVINQSRASTSIIDQVSSSASSGAAGAGSLPGFSINTLFQVNNGIGFYLALLMLALAALVNLLAPMLFKDRGAALAPAPAGAYPGATGPYPGAPPGAVPPAPGYPPQQPAGPPPGYGGPPPQA